MDTAYALDPQTVSIGLLIGVSSAPLVPPSCSPS
jgi:hypothetical protein